MRDTAPDARTKGRRIALLPLLTGLSALVLLAGLLLAPAVAPWLLRFEHWTADWRTALLSPSATGPHPQIALVTVTDETLKDYASSPIDRSLLARIVTATDQAAPKAIGLDVLFFKKTDEIKDAELVSALKSARSPVVLGALDERGVLTSERRAFQSAFLAATGRPVGYLNLRIEKDGVVRYQPRPAPASQYPASFARLIAEAGGAKAEDTRSPIRWTRSPAGGGTVFDTVLAHDLLGPKAEAEAKKLKGRLVLIGGDYPLPPRDRHRIPLSVRDGQSIPGVAVHAHILAGLIEPQRQIRELSPATTDMLLIALGVIGFLIGWSLWQSSYVGFLRWTFATGLLLAADAVGFLLFSLQLPFTLALVAWFAGVTAGSALHAAWASRKAADAPG